MIEFIEEPFVIKPDNKQVILPITVKPGLQPAGTEAVSKYFPSIIKTVEILQSQGLSVGSLLKDVSCGAVNISLLVTDFRARPGANVNYLTQALTALSAHLRGMEGTYDIAPLATEDEVPANLIKDLVTGIMGDTPANVRFHLK